MANKNSTEIFQIPKNTEYPRWELPDEAKMRLGKGRINTIKFSADGNRFAVATSIGVWIYDAQSGSIISMLKGERQDILDVAFSKDGNNVLGANTSGQILKWHAENGELISTLSNEKAIHLTSAVFDADGSKVYGVGRVRDEKLYVWELNDDLNPHVLVPIFTEIKLDVEFIGGYGKIITISPDGRFLATPRQEDHNEYFPIHIFDAHTSKLLFERSAQSNEGVNALTFSHDSKTLACASDAIYLWDTDVTEVKATFKALDTSVYALTFSPNGKLLVSGCSDGSIHLWNATAQQEGLGGTIGQYLPTLKLKGHKEKVNKLVFSPDGKTLLSGSDDGTIRAWDTTTGGILYTCPGHMQGIRHLAASEQTSILTSVDSYPTIVRLWDIKKGHQLSASYFGFTSSGTISPNATTISLDDPSDRKLRLWDIQNRGYRSYLKGHGYPSKFFLYTTIAFSKDEKRLATSPSRGPLGEIHIWHIGSQSNSIFSRYLFNAKTIRPKHTLIGHRGVVRSLVFSPDGKTLVSSGDGNRINLWDMETLRIRQKFVVGRNRSRSVTFSSNGKMLASRGTEKIYCWEATTGKQISEFPRMTGSFMSIQFCPDDSILVSGINTGEVQLWDISSGNFLSTHKGHTRYINDLRFLENGKTLATASADGTILLWNWEKMKTVIK
ncbi:WD40 repeat domain-containing protein [Candidatus Poribacteria bacterium]|nr:WD40 repeat domain-containing protein [Candidatus Poribacteria bacterium]